jgi:hypothetical protein
MRRRLRTFAVAGPLAPILAPLLVFHEGLAGRGALMPADGYATYLPWFQHAARAWRHGELPGWNAYAFGGSPLLAVSQAGVYYPPNWLHVFLPPLMALNLAVVLHFVTAGTGVWLLARRLTGDSLGATAAGLAFGLCGFFFAHVGHPSMIASAAWLPWVFYGYELLRERITPRRLLLASGCLALSFVAGHSQLAFTVVLALGLYALGVGLLVPKADRGHPFLACAALMAVALGLAAAQLLPTTRYLPDSSRARVSYEDAMTYSMPVSHTPLVLFPYLYGGNLDSGPSVAPYRGTWNLTELSAYPGMAALVLAAAGFGAARRDRRLLVLAGSAAVTALLALGPKTPLSRIVYHLPIYGDFRSWARYLIVTDLAVAVLAAYGVRALRSPRADERRSAMVRALAAAVVLAGLAVVVPRLAAIQGFLPEGGAQFWSLALPAAAAAGGAAAAAALGRRARFAPLLLVAVIFADAVGSFGWHYEWRMGSLPAAEVEANKGSRRTLWGGVVDQDGGLDRYLFIGADVTVTYPDFVGATDYKALLTANGSGPLAPGDYLETLGMSAFGGIGSPERLWAPNGRILDLLRVTTVLVDSALAPAVPVGSPLGSGTPVAGTSLVRYERIPTLPEAFVVGRAELRPRSEVVAALHGTEPFDPAELALLEQPCAPCPTKGGGGAPGSVERSVFEDNSVHVDVTAERPAMLVVSRPWLPGWRAQVDGRRAPVVRVDGLVQGVAVPAGHHRVSLRYVPPGARAGMALSLVTLAALLAWWGVSRRRRSTPPGHDPSPVGRSDHAHLRGDRRPPTPPLAPAERRIGR